MSKNFSRQNFPDDFVFGAATSSYQIEGAAAEGGKGPSIWDTYTHRYPHRIRDGSNGHHGIDSYYRYKEDIQVMKKMGFDAYRFSISWPRLLPSGRIYGGVNKEGIAFYNALIDELLANGIKPYATLFHWETPQALEDEYKGFLSENIVQDFHQFADLCFWEFGDRVKHWMTFNETWSYSVAGYVFGMFPPGRGTSVEHKVRSLPALGRFSSQKRRLLAEEMHAATNGISPAERLKIHGDPSTEPYTVTHNQLLCHADVVALYRDEYQLSQNGQIGLAAVAVWIEPLDPNNDDDKKAARRSIDFAFGWLMDPITYGDYPQCMRDNVGDRLPKFSREQKAMLKGSYDFLGLNYYTANYGTPSTEKESVPNYNTDSGVATSTKRNNVPIGDQPGTEWLCSYPEGIYKVLKHIKDNYKSPTIIITENGCNEISDVTSPLPVSTNDQFRIQYFNDHLRYIEKAIKEEGVDVKGYFAWSLMDNFEWADGFSVRFGMIHIDYNRGLARTPKQSAKWFRRFLRKAPLTTNKRALTTKSDEAPIKVQKI